MSNKMEVLERNTHNIIVALSETELGKIIVPNKFKWIDAETGEPSEFMNYKPSLDNEIRLLKYANTVHDLMPQFIRKQTWIDEEDGKEHEMMVIERLYKLPIHHFDLQKRILMMKILELQMKLLHKSQFVHGDFMRPTNFFTRTNKEWMFANIIQTETGLRLIDAGFAKIYSKDNADEFVHILMREEREITVFKDYYLSEK